MPKQNLFAVASLGCILIAPSAFSQTTTSYTYDDLGRVKSATLSSGQGSSYAYDNADNRTTMNVSTGGNHAPVCPTFVVAINPPTVNPVSVTVPLGSGCTDADGDTITVTSPAVPYTITVLIHTTTYVPFTVTDGHGGSAGGTITVYRP